MPRHLKYRDDYVLLLDRKYLDASVLLLTLGGLIVADKVIWIFSKPLDSHPLALNTAPEEIIHDPFSSLLRKYQVGAFGADIVGEAMYLDDRSGVSLHGLNELVKHLLGVVIRLIRSGLVLDIQCDLLHRRLYVDRAAVGIDLGAGRSRRALIEAVANAVGIAIQRAAGFVNAATFLRIGAFIQAIEHTVSIGIRWAARNIYKGPGGSIRAFIQAIIHPVLIGIQRAAGDIDNSALGRIGAIIKAIVDAITIAVQGTAVSVDHGVQGGIRAIVLLVADAVIIAVLDLGNHIGQANRWLDITSEVSIVELREIDSGDIIR